MEYVEDSMHELKENVGDSVPKTIAAFANTEGGELLIGIKDNGEVIGIEEKALDETQRKLEEYIKSIVPVPNHNISRLEINGKNVILVNVQKISDGFCTYKGVFYYRHGTETTKLEGSMLKDFLISRDIIYFDKLPANGANIDRDIDPEKVKAFLNKRSPAAAESNVNVVLESLGLVVASNGKKLPNNAAVLFFGKDPWKFFNQNEVRLASFSGYDTSSPVIDKKDIHFTIPENLEEAVKFIKMNTKASYEIRDLRRIEVPEYPMRVIREALVNALVHRDYFSADAVQVHIFNNRIEFINPGIPPGGISIKEIGHISVKRNPLIYQLMRDLGYMEGLATGIPLMRQEMRNANMHEPEFRIIGNFFILTLYNRLGKRSDFEELNKRQLRAIDYVRDKGHINSLEYVKLNNVSVPTAIADLRTMVNKGILKKVGVTRGSYYILAEGTE